MIVDVPADFDHLVLTRFSAVFDSARPPADDAWLDYRIGFFVDACLASMEKQVGEHVRWLVWFDDRCDPSFRRLVDDLAGDIFTPIWTHEPFWTNLRPTVESFSSKPHLITTRLDSDDAVARDFIASVQAQFAPSGPLWVNFPHGMQLDREGRVRRWRVRTNHFISLIEPTGSGRIATAFTVAHPHARTHAPVREVQSPPMWLEVLHGTNAMNGERGLPASSRALDERFDLTLPYPDQPGVLRRPGRLPELGARVADGLRHPWMLRDLGRTTVDRLRGTHVQASRS